MEIVEMRASTRSSGSPVLGAHHKQVQDKFLEIIGHLVPTDEIPLDFSREIVDTEYAVLISQALSHKIYKVKEEFKHMTDNQMEKMRELERSIAEAVIEDSNIVEADKLALKRIYSNPGKTSLQEWARSCTFLARQSCKKKFLCILARTATILAHSARILKFLHLFLQSTKSCKNDEQTLQEKSLDDVILSMCSSLIATAGCLHFSK